jgi:hypothetical protein
MCEPLSCEELARLTEALNEAETLTEGDGLWWPVVIDFQTFCSRLVSYGFSEIESVKAKAALLDAELARRFLGKAKGNR